jgi:hypothetical protein
MRGVSPALPGYDQADPRRSPHGIALLRPGRHVPSPDAAKSLPIKEHGLPRRCHTVPPA